MAFSRRNPLALMVLAVLWEHPTHPYQVVQILKGRRKDDAARLNYGSLYSVVASLEKAGLVEAVAVTREGGLPPRTTYQTTDAGAAEVSSWLSDLLARPAKEYPQFTTALSLLPALDPQTVQTLLVQRLEHLRSGVEALRAGLAEATAKIPELFSVETTYTLAMAEAELAFVERLAQRLAAGQLSGLDGWRWLHSHGERPGPEQIYQAFNFADDMAWPEDGGA
ncbi:MAG: PadR family transcriptional regulator [Micrococcales bacterium]|nr:PadR family transcriptional regulator [Micrococcales bacterium]MCL2667649.1 PadR family transcriptional regulator [Micrococcales bacterium]